MAQNQYVVTGDITYIILYKKKKPVCSAIIDTKNFLKVSPYRWYLWGDYVEGKCFGQRSSLHRLILGSPKEADLVADHIDGDPLNNLESNLRYVTHNENVQNSERYREVHGDEHYKPRIVRKV